ncbi:hypothetical protein CEXT_762991 [Caerostris extrusa]|uniref:Uncharacterized protein n=1 Tax=Caerostris extrusa TaxID=172846 RepID=A0AAV4PLW7_CAEEX|nr:hypothetical protein CEXT_762991 [Caerostris extrusa]
MDDWNQFSVIIICKEERVSVIDPFCLFWNGNDICQPVLIEGRNYHLGAAHSKFYQRIVHNPLSYDASNLQQPTPAALTTRAVNLGTWFKGRDLHRRVLKGQTWTFASGQSAAPSGWLAELKITSRLCGDVRPVFKLLTVGY